MLRKLVRGRWGKQGALKYSLYWRHGEDAGVVHPLGDGLTIRGVSGKRSGVAVGVVGADCGVHSGRVLPAHGYRGQSEKGELGTNKHM